MGLEILELVLDVEKQYAIELEEPVETLGDLFLIVLYKLRKKSVAAAPEGGTDAAEIQLLNDEQTLNADLFRQLNDFSLMTTVAQLLRDARILPNVEAEPSEKGSEAGNTALAIVVDTKLKDLFPIGSRTFRWNRFRRMGMRRGWDIPPLRSCAAIDNLTRWGGEGALYCGIYVLFLAVLVTVGMKNPLGDGGRTLFWLALLYIPVYVIAVFILSTLEYLLGLYRLPEKRPTPRQDSAELETAGELADRLKELNFLKWSREMGVQKIEDSSLSLRQQEIWSVLKTRYGEIYGGAPDEISFDSEL